MKKLYLTFSLLLVLSGIKVSATVWDVDVSNIIFTPNTMNVIVGDTVRWHWVSGGHNTTSQSVPAGAATWGAPIDNVNTTFDYIVTVAGTYAYVCTFHGGMAGGFVATGGSGINTPSTQAQFSVYSDDNSLFTFSYSLSSSANVNMSIVDLTGKLVRTFLSAEKSGGEYLEYYDLSDLSSGIYIVQFNSDNQRITRRIVIE